MTVFNTTFNNISAISWRSVLLVEGTGVPGENHRRIASHWQTLSYNVVSSTLRHEWGSNSQLIAQIVVNLTTIWSRSRPRQPHLFFCLFFVVFFFFFKVSSYFYWEMEFKSRQLSFIKEIIIFLKLPQGQKKILKNIFTVINGHSMFLVIFTEDWKFKSSQFSLITEYNIFAKNYI